MALFLPASELQLARGESYRDTAIVLSRFLSALMIRTFDQEEVETFAEHASIPVINGLTDDTHPLQALADAMTLRERFGSLAGLRLAYVGDGNNVCHSLMRIAARLGMHFVAATPAGYEPRCRLRRRQQPRTRTQYGGSVEVDDRSRRSGARRAGRSTPTSGRAWARTPSASGASATSSPTGSTTRCSRVADPDAVAMHCLPAHAGRGDRRRRPVRAALPRVGAGREPPAHAEGADGARHPVTFEDTCPAALDELPPELAAGPRERRRRRRGREPGRPRPPRSLPRRPTSGARRRGGPAPDTISIYRIPLEESFPDPDELRRRSASPCLHELAHYFGLDEEQLARARATTDA